MHSLKVLIQLVYWQSLLLPGCLACEEEKALHFVVVQEVVE